MAVEPEFLSNNPQDEDDFFLIEEESDTGEMFDHLALYTTEEFLRILHMLMRRYMDDATFAPMIDVLEHWEHRVLDFVTAHPDSRDDVRVGFRLDEDEVMRMYFALSGNVLR